MPKANRTAQYIYWPLCTYRDLYSVKLYVVHKMYACASGIQNAQQQYKEESIASHNTKSKDTSNKLECILQRYTWLSLSRGIISARLLKTRLEKRTLHGLADHLQQLRFDP
jgi:hypothetical protein